MRFRLLVAGLFATAASTALAQAPVGPSGTVSAILQADWDTLDPHRTRSTYGFQLATIMYDRVVALDASGRIVPYLAESWDVEPKGVTFRIRPGVTCADGSPVSAETVARSFQRLADPATRAPYLTRTFGKDAPTITHDAAQRSVSIRLAGPHSDLLLGLAMPWSSIVCQAGLENGDALQSSPQGSGPFRLVESRRGDRYTFTARADHAWGPSGALATIQGFPGTLVLRVSPNATTSANLLITGEVNLVSVTGRDVERLARERGLHRTDMMLFGSDMMLYSQAPGRVTLDAKVRRALSHALDPAAFNRAFSFGLGTPLDTMTTPSMQCYEAGVGISAVRFDVNASHALLREAGWKRNARGLYERDGQTLRIRIAGNRLQNAGPEYVLEAWRAIGVDASLTTAEFNTWLETLNRTADWDASVMPFNSVLPSPSLFVPLISGPPSPVGSNFMGAENPAFVEAARAALAGTANERCPLWAVTERVPLEAADVRPLVGRNVSTFTRGVMAQMLSGTVFDPHSLRSTR